jgi:ketosteroid isomerase-like protein
MKTFVLTGLLLLATTPALAHEPATAATPTASTIGAQLAPVAQVADRFAAALKAADFETVRALLDEHVVILESGGAERSRDEYMGHHAIADASFLGGATVDVTHRSGGVQGNTAWLATESTITPAAGSDEKPMLSTETLVLSRASGAWRIVHIHWSSRAKKSVTP